MKRMLLKLAAIVLMTGASVAVAETPRSEDFAVRLPLVTSSEGLHVLELSEAVYRAAQSRTLADMRIFNARGEALPIAFLPAPPSIPPTAAAIDLRIVPLPALGEARDSLLKMYALRIERDGDRAVVELGLASPQQAATGAAAPSDIGGYLIDARGLKNMKGQLVLAFQADASDYAGRVQVLGSEDLVSWRPLAAGPLTRNRKLGETIERTKFDLNRPPPFVRVAWASKEAPAIAGAQFAEQLAPVVNLPRATLATVLSENRRTMYVDVPDALPIEQVFVRMPELNRIVRAQVYRHEAVAPRVRRPHLAARRAHDIWQPMGSIEAFRVIRDGVEIEGVPLSIHARTDRLRLDFAAPLEGAVPTIEAQWRPGRVVFAALAPGPYVLAVGHRDLRASPSLDARAVLATDDPAGTRLPTATIGMRADAAPDSQHVAGAAEGRWAQYLLWVVLAFAVGGLAFMAWRLSLQMRHVPARTDAKDTK